MEQTITIKYDDANYIDLLASIDGLRTFSEVAKWDTAAQEEIAVLERVIETTDRALAQTQRERAEALRAYEEKNAVARLLGGKRDVSAAERMAATLTKHRAHFQEMADNLQSQIDFTPNSPDEQTALLKELHHYKRELQQEKKEINAAMREVRVAARQATANIGPNFGSKFVGQLNAAQRRSIRYQKEAALGPNEDRKTAIERQLISIDRRILWAERLQE